MASTSARSPLHPAGSPPSPKDDGDVDDQFEGQSDPQLDEGGLARRANMDYYPKKHHQAQFEEIRSRTGSLDQCEALGLNRLQESDPNERPGYPLPVIVKCAINGSPRERLTLSEIYLAMERRFPYFVTANKASWRNSVRHNLSLNSQFIQEDRPETEPGRGKYWVIAKDTPKGNKRPRKRNKKPGKRALAQMALETAKKKRQERGEHSELESAPALSSDHTPTSLPSSSSIPTDPTFLGVSTIAPTFTFTHGTLPANAGSYAAVTGLLHCQYYTPWDSSAAAAAVQVSSVAMAPVASGSGTPIQGVSADAYGSSQPYVGHVQSFIRGGTPPPPP